MASSGQLSENNSGGRIHSNSSSNTERQFRECVADAFHEVRRRYPEETFLHRRRFSNRDLVDVLSSRGLSHVSPSAGGKGGCSPDGGVISVQTVSGAWLPVFIGENKWQEANAGNAVERAVKNVVFFQHLLVAHDYFPYMINLNGGIADPRYGTLFDRVSMVGGFMPLNRVFVRGDPAEPRVRPFSFFVSEQFDREAIYPAILQVVDESVAYLRGAGELRPAK